MKSSTAPLPALKSPKVLDQLRERLRYLHYSIRTEEAYVHWVRAFIRFHGLRHPQTMGGAEVEAFLAWLANTRGVAASTHKQALSALLFFYGKVLGADLPWMTEIGRPRTKRRLPVVLSPDEVARILCLLDGEHRLFAQLLYGTGMRITEGLQLRVKDIDFERGTIIVREGKGGKDRAVMLPQSLVPALREQLARARVLWAAASRPNAAPVRLVQRFLNLRRLLLAFAAVPAMALAQEPSPGDAALHRALLGVWCNSNDGGRTCWAWDEFYADGTFEACGRTDDDPRPFRGGGRVDVTGRRMCYVVTFASENFWVKPGGRYCTDIVAIDGSTHRYRDIDTGAEFTLHRIPKAEKRCPAGP